MDAGAYDYVHDEGADGPEKTKQETPEFMRELDEAYHTFSATRWGATFGQLVGTVRRQVGLCILVANARARWRMSRAARS